MTTIPHPLLSHAHNPFGIGHLQAALLESLLVTVVGLFWLTVLPIGAVFSAAVVVYNNIVAFRSTALRLPYLRSHLATNPLVLGRKGFALGKTSVRTSSRNQIARG